MSRPATRTRSSSPAGWPKASLTDLKLSRSRHKTAIGCGVAIVDGPRLVPIDAGIEPDWPDRSGCHEKLPAPLQTTSVWFSTSITNCRASTAATRIPSAASSGPCCIRPTARPNPTAAASSSGKYGNHSRTRDVISSARRRGGRLVDTGQRCQRHHSQSGHSGQIDQIAGVIAADRRSGTRITMSATPIVAIPPASRLRLGRSPGTSPRQHHDRRRDER